MNSLMGVLFVDYERGAATLQLTGRAEVINDSLGIPGAQRVLRFSIDEFVHVSSSLGMTQLRPGPSRKHSLDCRCPQSHLSFTVARQG